MVLPSEWLKTPRGYFPSSGDRFFFKKNHCFGTHKAPSDLREEVKEDKKEKGGKSKIL